MSLVNSRPRVDTDNDPLLRVSNLKKHFEQSDGFLDRILGGGGTVHAVDGVDLDVHAGETVAIVGESGCGKTTLGQTLLRLLEPTEGSIEYSGTDLTGLSDAEMREYRRKMQMIFQDPQASLNPRKAVGEILEVPLRVHDIGADREERQELIEDTLERVGLKRSHLNRHPRQFSGGQQQRLGIARALMLEPELIVADEPTSALDVSVQAQILNLLGDLQAEMELSIVFITHDLSVVRHTADRVVVMYLGKVVETGQTEEVFSDPAHPYTRSLLSSVPRIEERDRRERILLEGTVPSPVDPPNGCRFNTRCPSVVPPDDWEASQALFRRAFDFRFRITNGQIDVDAVESRLDSQSNGETPDVASYLVDRTFGDDLSALGDDRVKGIRDAAAALAAHDDGRAAERIAQTLPSPCEREQPPVHDLSDTHAAACIRLDEKYHTLTERPSGER